MLLNKREVRIGKILVELYFSAGKKGKKRFLLYKKKKQQKKNCCTMKRKNNSQKSVHERPILVIRIAKFRPLKGKSEFYCLKRTSSAI